MVHRIPSYCSSRLSSSGIYLQIHTYLFRPFRSLRNQYHKVVVAAKRAYYSFMVKSSSGMEFMAQHLIGLNLTCQIVCSVSNAHMIYPNLIRAAMVYPRALYSDLCFLTVRPVSVHLFPHSHSVIICMLMTPSCSYPSSPPSSMKIFLACKLLLVPSLTG